MGVYGTAWVGLVAAAVGVVVGVVMMRAENGSVLLGAATVALSTALGTVVYLISKILDRQ